MRQRVNIWPCFFAALSRWPGTAALNLHTFSVVCLYSEKKRSTRSLSSQSLRDGLDHPSAPSKCPRKHPVARPAYQRRSRRKRDGGLHDLRRYTRQALSSLPSGASHHCYVTFTGSTWAAPTFTQAPARKFNGSSQALRWRGGRLQQELCPTEEDVSRVSPKESSMASQKFTNTTKLRAVHDASSLRLESTTSGTAPVTGNKDVQLELPTK